MGIFILIWMIFSPSEKSYAEEVTVQVSPAPSESSTSTIENTAQMAVTEAQTAVSSAQTTIQTVDTQANSLSNSSTVDQAITTAQTSIDTVNQNIQVVQSAVSSLDAAQSAVQTQENVVQQATENVTQATQEVSIATQEVAQAETQVTTDTQNVATQTQVLQEAQTNLTNAQTNLQAASTAVDNQEPVVAAAQENKNVAQAVVDQNTSPGLAVTVYSNPGTNASPQMGGTVVYTGTDTNGINEQWGSGGPTVNGATTTTTVTETFAGNHLNTNIGITVNGTPVSTTNNSGVYIGSIGFPGPGQDPSLNLYTPTAQTLITLPTNSTSASFQVFAKNGTTTGLITYSDGTTAPYELQHNVSSEYTNYVHTETFTAPEGKTISTITVPADWDYFAVDNISATQQVTSTTTVTEDFQVRWQGIWTPQTTGTQYITASADDGTRLYLDGQLVIDDWYDKGGGGSTADVETMAGVSKTLDFWYYENGGGAAVHLLRYTGDLGWAVISPSEFSTSTATATQIATLNSAIQTLNTEQATLTTLQQAETSAQDVVTDKTNIVSQQTLVVQTAQNDLQISQQVLNNEQQNLTTAQTNLTTAQENLTTETQNLTNLNTQVQAAEVSVSMAVSNLNTSVQQMQNNIVNVQTAYSSQAFIEEQQRHSAALAAALANAYNAPDPVQPTPPTPVEPEPEVDTPEDQVEPEVEDPVDPTPEEPVDEPSIETPEDTTDTTDTTDSNDETDSDTTDEETSVEDDQSSLEEDTPLQEEDTDDIPTEDTLSEPETPVEPTPEPSNNDTPESTPGLVENNPNSLPETTPKLPEPSQLVPRVQVDKPGVENGGIEFFGTKSQPQVVGEDGKLTPPPPPPGSGLPIPPEAITTEETFIGQPGGTTFNAPDIAVPVIMKYVCTTLLKEDGTEIHLDLDGNEHLIEECTFLPEAFDIIPGAGEAVQALGAAYATLANIGNDMSPVTRKKAKKVLVATLIAVPIARRRFGQ